MTELHRAETAEEVLTLLGFARAHQLISAEEIETRTRDVLDRAMTGMLAGELGEHFSWDSLKQWSEIEEELRAHLALAQAERGPLVGLRVVTEHAEPVIPIRRFAARTADVPTPPLTDEERDSIRSGWLGEWATADPAAEFRRQVLDNFVSHRPEEPTVGEQFLPTPVATAFSMLPTVLSPEQVEALLPRAASSHLGSGIPPIVPAAVIPASVLEAGAAAIKSVVESKRAGE